MKQLILTFMASLILVHTSSGQEAEGREKSIRIGFQLNEFQDDFGLGLNFKSPSILYGNVAVRLRTNLMFNEHMDKGEYTWSPYMNVMLGIGSEDTYISDKVSLYGEGGVIGIFPSASFSSKTTVVGGYGLFGFNFYFHPSFNYFIELGGIGSSAVEDKLEGNPIYSNGFLISVGWKMKL